MAAQLRELRARIRSIRSTAKITKAYELIATSRIAKAQRRVEAARPYAEEITTVLSALATSSSAMLSSFPLIEGQRTAQRAGVLVISSDKGFAGAYNANVFRKTEELLALLREQGKEPVLNVIGRKGHAYYSFRQRQMAGTWSGFSEQPAYDNAAEAGAQLVEALRSGELDELHVVYTRFDSMLTQTPVAHRVAPLEVSYSDPEHNQLPDYEFEPEAEELLRSLLPKYIKTRVFSALLDAAASESAARQQAMKAATDNANELIDDLTREANQARQAQITQEISEIVGGADALAGAGSDG